ncbi:MAG: hypothetical protein ACE144_12870 [Thermodesulfobacteriota bacterium]
MEIVTAPRTCHCEVVSTAAISRNKPGSRRFTRDDNLYSVDDFVIVS